MNGATGTAGLMMLLACGREPAPAATATIEILDAAALADDAPAPAVTHAPAQDASPPPAPPHVARCAAGQLNVPCVMQRSQECFLRWSNCTEKPCHEGPLQPVDCASYQAAPPATACEVAMICGEANEDGCEPAPCRVPSPMLTCIAGSCAPVILAATSCRQVHSALLAATCRLH